MQSASGLGADVQVGMYGARPCLRMEARGGDPRNILELPLASLMPGSSLVFRTFAAARIALLGACAMLFAFFPIPSWRAVRYAVRYGSACGALGRLCRWTFRVWCRVPLP